MVYSAGIHHRYTGELSHVKDEIVAEYKSLTAELVKIAARHEDKRGFLVETVPQLFPNESGAYEKADATVKPENFEYNAAARLCDGPHNVEKFWTEANWRNDILKQQVLKHNISNDRKSTLIELVEYFINKKQLMREM